MFDIGFSSFASQKFFFTTKSQRARRKNGSHFYHKIVRFFKITTQGFDPFAYILLNSISKWI